jgi:cytochrome c oxidase cbb3-type subunit 3
MGQRLFLTYCASCHQSGGQGTLNYPNLTDQDWLWGGEPARIEETITMGRTGIMPAWGPILGEQGMVEIASYVMTLSDRKPADPSKVAAGKEKFGMYCTVCHGPEGKGNQQLGAPNLTDKTWLHISHREAATDAGLEAGIRRAVTGGFTNAMPTWGERLGQAKVHLLAGYVYSLSNP